MGRAIIGIFSLILIIIISGCVLGPASENGIKTNPPDCARLVEKITANIDKTERGTYFLQAYDAYKTQRYKIRMNFTKMDFGIYRPVGGYTETKTGGYSVLDCRKGEKENENPEYYYCNFIDSKNAYLYLKFEKTIVFNGTEEKSYINIRNVVLAGNLSIMGYDCSESDI